MKRFYLFALVATLFAACATDATQDLAPEIPTSPDELYVSFDEESRVQLNAECKTVWTKDDLVSVFYRSNANQKWQFQGNTGDTEGTLKRIDAGTATQQTTQIVAVYPYNENYWFNWNTYNVEASLPAEQTYLANSYGIGSSLMVSSSEFNQLSFKNVCGWLKLQFTGTGYLSNIVLRGNNGEQVAGKIYVNTSDASCVLASEMGDASDGTGGALVFDDTILTEITLNCGDVALNPETPTAFYIALPPQTFANGLTATMYGYDGSTKEVSTNNAITIERNHIVPMKSLALEMPIPNNEIWYTSLDGNIVEPYKTDVFGATILSNTYEDGKGIIKFNGNVTSIGKYAFSSCSALKSVTIGNSVTSIGSYAFDYCEALTSVTIGNSVTSIGGGAFAYCSALTSFYGKFASEDNRCLIIDGVLNSFAPAGLTSYTIPNSVTSIGYFAFGYCYALTNITIPNSVTSIGGYAFSSCSALTSINIPNSVTWIGNSAFVYCSALESFYGKFASEDNRCLIIDGVLNSFAPAGLTSYTIPNSVTSIGEEAFWGCYALTSITIPNSVTSIGYSAFEYCSSLTSVTIPNSVTEIGNSAFYNCSALTSVTIPNSVTSIGDSAFSGCHALTSITIPNSVTEIGYGAFYYCLALKEVYCKPTTPPTGGSGMFDSNASGRRIFVPIASVDAYKTASGWGNYASAIEPYNFTE